MAVIQKIIRRSFNLMERHSWVIPTFGFISGVASFFMVERKQDQFAQIMSILMLLGWLWLTLEKLLQRGISHWFGITVPPGLLRYVTQLVHQESLFFVIPFFFITTSWNSGQMVFTSLLIAAAFISIIDPIYYRWLAPRRWLYFIYHGITLFSVLLVALPLIFHLPTPKSYLWALGIAVLLSLPGIARNMTINWWKRFPLIVLLMLLTCGVGFLVRPWIPPASIWLTQVAITDHIDDASRSPNNKLKVISADQLRDGIYAYTAIHAPRGLNERIYHVWRRNGKLVDKIALDISGGREEGYRAWSHKINFPEDSIGSWQIYVVTEASQVIGVLRFQVVGSVGAVESSQSTSMQSTSSQEVQPKSVPADVKDKNPEQLIAPENSSQHSEAASHSE